MVLTSRDATRAAKAASEIGGAVQGISLDLSQPHAIAGNLAGVGPVDHVVLAAIDRDANTVAAYSIAEALHLVTLKLVGYTEVVHALTDRLTGMGSILLFGGMARVRPYPGSTTVSAINAGVIGMVRTLSVELAPIRVNSIHPGIVGDSPFWEGKKLDAVVANTLTGRLTTMAEVVGACGLPAGERQRQRRGPDPRRRLAMTAQSVAVVGTGRMGAAMAGRLLGAGHRVTALQPNARKGCRAGRPGRRARRVRR